MSDKNYFKVVTEEVRGGYEKSREFVAVAEGFGKTLYKYHQTIREGGYDDCSKGDKHTLVKNGNVISIDAIEQIDKSEYLDEKNQGKRELKKQV
jgi:hypothetical protein